MGNAKNIGRQLVAVGVLLILGLQGVRSEYGDLAGDWLVDYGIDELNFHEDSIWRMDLHIYNVLPKDSALDYCVVVYSKDERRVSSPPLEIQKEDFDLLGSWRGALYVTGVRFGYSSLEVQLKAGAETETYPKPLPITVLRTQVVDQRITTYVSAVLALLMFLNLGTVLDMERLAGIICRPVGPVVGVVSRYVLMPALAFGLGRALWPASWPLQLALFYTALAPSGGLANVCAVFLKGNINLSVATTTINSLLALALLPIWILLLGRILYEDDGLTVPFGQLSGGAAALVACLAIGVLLRLCVPRTTRFIFRFLKPLSVVLSLCLVGLTVGLNSFVFYEFTWQVLVAAVCLPLAGYLSTYLLSKILCRSPTDALTLSVEASVLNMTMPIVLLQSSQLEQPQLDLVLVVPIASSLLSLVLVVLYYGIRRCLGCNAQQDADGYDHKQLMAEHEGAV